MRKTVAASDGLDTLLAALESSVCDQAAAADDLVRQHWKAIEAVATELLKCKTLSGDRIEQIVRDHTP